MEYKDANVMAVKAKKKSKAGLIVTLIIIGLVIISGVLIFVFKREWITNLFKKSSNNSQEVVKNSDGSTYDPLSKLTTPNLVEDTIIASYLSPIKLENLKGDGKGYTFDIVMENKVESVSVYECKNVLIDDIITDTSFKVEAAPLSTKRVTVNIPKTKLDTYGISNFTKITFIGSLVNGGSKPENSIKSLSTVSTGSKYNVKKTLLKIDNIKGVSVNYYELVEDEDYTYLYFDVFHNNEKLKTNIRIKKIAINGEIYDYDDLDESYDVVGIGIFVIKIPKDDYKKVKNVDLQLFYTFKDEKDNTIYYIGSETSMNVEKNR